jgi:hypothetical protein
MVGDSAGSIVWVFLLLSVWLADAAVSEFSCIQNSGKIFDASDYVRERVIQLVLRIGTE